MNIKFPDGSIKQYEEGTTPLQIAESISPRLAADVLAATVDGEEWDLTRPIVSGGELKLLSGTRSRVSMHFGTRRRTCLQKRSKNSIPECVSA